MDKPVVLHLSVSEASWVLNALRGEVLVLRQEGEKVRRSGGSARLQNWWDSVALKVEGVAARLQHDLHNVRDEEEEVP